MTDRIPNGIVPNQNGTGDERKSKSPEEIEAEITRTRSAISSDLNELGDKFSPDKIRESAKGVLQDAKQEARELVKEVKDSAVGSLRDVKDSAVESLLSAKDSAVESVTGTVHEIGDQARRAGGVTARFVSENAVPLSLIGLGVAWLTMSLRRRQTLQSDYGSRRFRSDYDFDLYTEGDYDLPTSSTHLGESGMRRQSRGRVSSARQRVGEVAGRAAERVEDMTQQARDKVGEAASRLAETGGQLKERARDRLDDAGHRATQLSHDARDQLRRAQVGARDMAQENPLAVGAVAVAAGIGVGLLLPATRRENELMGPTRSRLVDDARGYVYKEKVE